MLLKQNKFYGKHCCAPVDALWSAEQQAASPYSPQQVVSPPVQHVFSSPEDRVIPLCSVQLVSCCSARQLDFLIRRQLDQQKYPILMEVS